MLKPNLEINTRNRKVRARRARMPLTEAGVMSAIATTETSTSSSPDCLGSLIGVKRNRETSRITK